MALYRQIFIDFWRDPKVTEELSAEDRYVLLYLLTNPYTTQIGIYTVTKRQVAFDLGYSTESVSAILDRFEKLHKMIKYNANTREIAIKNWGKYNLKRGGKPVLDCVKSELEKVKDKNLIEYVSRSIPNESIKEVFLRYVDDTSAISGQEQEEEQEEEEQQLEKNVAVNKVKSYFVLSDNEIEKIINTLKDTNRDSNYLEEKLRLTKNTDCKSVVGFLIKAIKEDYKPHKNNVTKFRPKVTNFHYNAGNESFSQYEPDELERLLKESQKGKFD